MSNYPPSLNPFLVDEDLLSNADSYNTAALPPNYPPPPPPMTTNFKLPAFWPDAPVAWFAAVEAQFRLRRVASEDERFCHVTGALDKQSLKKVVHLVINPDPVAAYSKLKEALLSSHHLTDFQRVELLHAMEPLGSRKPSELLADMLELCPIDQQNNIFFSVLFLQRLPRDIRVLLTHEDHTDLRRLAAHADRLVAYGGRTDTVAAAVDAAQEDTVAAVKNFKQKNNNSRNNQQQRSQQPPPVPPRAQGGQKTQKVTPPAAVAQQSAGLCYYHWSFGERANSCRAPCTWQGN